MVVVTARPHDDEEIVETYMADHEHYTAKVFESEWDAALEKAKAERPETWCVGEVIQTLRDRGWQIIRVNTVTVTY
jgi:hypothetical protein